MHIQSFATLSLLPISLSYASYIIAFRNSNFTPFPQCTQDSVLMKKPNQSTVNIMEAEKSDLLSTLLLTYALLDFHLCLVGMSSEQQTISWFFLHVAVP